ncbi:hypothetical protein SDC9_192659 [bioreactor metagenome]|uniref:Ribosomal protein YlxQ n=1 Tax=bioreactor metagenome TaxID=1076179 RepID=A0A645I2V1_9ZZZZ|nr:hypothetical protein [Candidatus Pelethousia sp.]NCB30131.1 hypothetical protein [Clostridia bacterium]
MDEARVRSAAGFAMRAGCCLAGDFACEKAVKAGRVQVILLDTAASQSTRERYHGLCERAGIPCLELENMGNAIGKYGRMVAAVTDSGFARMLTEAAEGGGTNQHGGA